jgi:hypothetical protein
MTLQHSFGRTQQTLLTVLQALQPLVPLTGGTITSTGSIGLDQTALSLTRSQISDFASGTVTSAGTAQQAGTAVYSVNSGTAVYATTSGTAVFATNASTAVNLSGSITKSQVSDFTSGTVASAGTAQQSGTAVFANTSGTATYATTSGTAVTISGDITKSQVSDFTSGTVVSASTAQQAGTAVYALTSGTATFATTSGTATFATNAGTAVFATNASTAVTISGSITQSQVTSLVTDLAGKASLGSANTFSVGGHVINNAATGTVPIRVNAITGQTANQLEFANTSGAITNSVNGAGTLFIGPVGNQSFISGLDGRASILNSGSSNIAFTVRGASGQANDFFTINNVGGTALMRVNLNGSAFFGTTTGNYPTFFGASGSLAGMINVVPASAAVIPIIIRGAASQSANLLEIQNSAASILGRFESTGDLWVTGAVRSLFYTNRNNTGAYFDFSTGTPAVIQRAPAEIAMIVRGASGQTANLQQWENGGVVQSFIGPFGNAGFGTAGTVYGRVGINTGTTGTLGLVIRGVASQTADLIQAQTSAGTSIWSVSANGALTVNNQTTGLDSLLVQRAGSTHFRVDPFNNTFAAGTFTVGANSTGGSIQAGVYSSSATNVGLVVRGAASQSADLLQLQNSSGTILSLVNSSGSFRVASIGAIAAGNAALTPGGDTNGFLLATVNAGNKGLVVRGAGSQTADLQQWQNSAGGVSGKFDAFGYFTANGGYVLASSGGSLERAFGGAFLGMAKTTSAVSNPGANIARMYLVDGTVPGTLKLVVRAGAAGAETTILDNIPQ